MSRQTLNLTNDLYDYLLKVSLREPAILKELRELTATRPGSNMQIAPEQGQFMALLVQLLGAKKTLDIGVFTGYSSLVVALALPPEGKVIACDCDAQATAIAQDYWQRAGVAEKVDFRLAPALETLDQLLVEGQGNTFDFAFIDADKGNYLNYYERCLQLVRSGGVIAIDNVLWSGRVIEETDQENNTQAIRTFNAAIAQDDRITLSLLPLADGLTLARKH